MTPSIETTVVKEGDLSLVVPVMSEPQKIPAFFNPKGKHVRDISIVCYKAFSSMNSGRKLTFADALAGVGVRGLRFAMEVKSSSKVFINDINPTAIVLAKRTAEMNGLADKCVFSSEEICSFLDSRLTSNGERFDVLDIDPFGTPSPFVDCGIRAVADGGLLSVAATDSAVLCGVYPSVCQRKYLGLPLRTDYSHEIGLRLIYGLLAMTAMRFETGIVPLFCHHDMHYFRVYCQIKVGNSFSRDNEVKIGFILHCFNCGYRSTVQRNDLFGASQMRRNTGNGAKAPVFRQSFPVCPVCSKSSLKLGGPLWIGRIRSEEFVAECAKISDATLFREEELDLPLYYDLTSVSQELHLRTPKLSDVLSRLQEAGHLASRTHLNPQAIRTDAPLQEIRAAVRELSL